MRYKETRLSMLRRATRKLYSEGLSPDAQLVLDVLKEHGLPVSEDGAFSNARFRTYSEEVPERELKALYEEVAKDMQGELRLDRRDLLAAVEQLDGTVSLSNRRMYASGSGSSIKDEIAGALALLGFSAGATALATALGVALFAALALYGFKTVIILGLGILILFLMGAATVGLVHFYKAVKSVVSEYVRREERRLREFVSEIHAVWKRQGIKPALEVLLNKAEDYGLDVEQLRAEVEEKLREY